MIPQEALEAACLTYERTEQERVYAKGEWRANDEGLVPLLRQHRPLAEADLRLIGHGHLESRIVGPWLPVESSDGEGS